MPESRKATIGVLLEVPDCVHSAIVILETGWTMCGRDVRVGDVDLAVGNCEVSPQGLLVLESVSTLGAMPFRGLNDGAHREADGTKHILLKPVQRVDVG